jgi:hypothetical protein
VEEIDVSERAAVRGPRTPVRRRVIAVVAVGALAIGALGACRSSFSEPGAAAFVGSTTITEAQVRSAVAGIKDTTQTDEETQRQYLLDLVYIDLLKQYAAQQGIQLAEPTADVKSFFATQSGVKAADASTNPYVLARSRAQSYAESAAAAATPVTPTDAELQPMFGRAVAAKLADPSDFAGFKTAILGFQATGTDGVTKIPFTNYAGLENSLAKLATSDNVTISPRFGQTCTAAPCAGLTYSMLPLSDGQGNTFDTLELPIGGVTSDPPVIDTAQ